MSGKKKHYVHWKAKPSQRQPNTMPPQNLTDTAPQENPGVSPPKNFYRPDVDGLRALAVLPVIAFHAGFSCPGGFIGVDVFFVISGYLITQIIERELKAHRFSVLVFYQRRIRRIFPALFAMLAASTLVAYLFLPPMELAALGESLVAASAFSSNILFFRWSGYFAPNSEFTPLLHTWTLSLEEQFYVCWPLILAALSLPAARRWKIPSTVAVLIGTLMLSAHWVSSNPNVAFYLLPSRAWELALGALLSFSPIARTLARLPRALASLASLAGIGLLTIAVVTYSRATPFPGLAALLPCMGAALVIAAGEGGSSIGGKFLSLRPLVWLGMISYSLYLWHWPILVFGHILANRKLDAMERGGLVVLIFVVSWLSWRFVESPFRKAHVVRAKVKSWVVGGLATSAVFVAAGAILYLGHGLPARGPNVGDFEQEAEALQKSPCLARGGTLPVVQGCLLGAKATASRYEIVLWGDSHAAHLAPAFNEIGQRMGLTTRQITKAGCSPLPGVGFLPFDEARAACPAFNEAALRAVLAEKDVRVVVLAARWDVFVAGNLLLTTDGMQPSPAASRQLLVSSLRKLLTELAASGRQVILVGQVPLPPPESIICTARARFRGLEEDRCEMGPAKVREQTEVSVNQALLEAARHVEAGIHIVHPYDDLCGPRGCVVQSGGQMLYSDESHLSSSGAHLLASDLQKVITSALTAVKQP